MNWQVVEVLPGGQRREMETVSLGEADLLSKRGFLFAIGLSPVGDEYRVVWEQLDHVIHIQVSSEWEAAEKQRMNARHFPLMAEREDGIAQATAVVGDWLESRGAKRPEWMGEAQLFAHLEKMGGAKVAESLRALVQHPDYRRPVDADGTVIMSDAELRSALEAA